MLRVLSVTVQGPVRSAALLLRRRRAREQDVHSDSRSADASSCSMRLTAWCGTPSVTAGRAGRDPARLDQERARLPARRTPDAVRRRAWKCSCSCYMARRPAANAAMNPR